jgi:hypothetical protein
VDPAFEESCVGIALGGTGKGYGAGGDCAGAVTDTIAGGGARFSIWLGDGCVGDLCIFGDALERGCRGDDLTQDIRVFFCGGKDVLRLLALLLLGVDDTIGGVEFWC